MLRVVVVQFGARRERCSAFPSWWHCWHACAVERALQRWRVMLLAVRGIVGVHVQWNWRCSADMSCCLPCVVALLVPVYCGTCAAALVCRVANSTSRRGVPHASSSFVALIVFFHALQRELLFATDHALALGACVDPRRSVGTAGGSAGAVSEMKRPAFQAAMETQARSDMREELREKRAAAVADAQAAVTDARKKHRAARKEVGGGDGDGGGEEEEGEEDGEEDEDGGVGRGGGRGGGG